MDNSVLNPKVVPNSMKFSVFMYAWSDEFLPTGLTDNTILTKGDNTYKYLDTEFFNLNLVGGATYEKIADYRADTEIVKE